ncbi:hypothetical protein ATN84_04860 [Paramesorhizobium deserti]|uniref:DUF982 domain-containing protein n=1 Tax=Paramesorhizobium deserti TaxID=1494590 RepID=A0A135I0V0_9HYPH|nr:DUF982 domain-containing protein [Paramesorhizobium deserti]KXF79065.1 hypothetical protein ATN84_04860 [Paramesorhizobium deserti]
MDDKRFPVPVVIRIGEARSRVVASAWEAVECLKTYWPRNRDRSYRQALQTCLDALDGLKPVAKARRAFVHAAKEAGLILRSASTRNRTGHGRTADGI